MSGFAHIDPADFIGGREVPRMTDAERKKYDQQVADFMATREQRALFQAARDRVTK